MITGPAVQEESKQVGDGRAGGHLGLGDHGKVIFDFQEK